jgi:heme/copper-type cytochrome/quinol oxidase subunit 4
LGNPKSFTRRDFEPLLHNYNDLLTSFRASTPTSPEATTPAATSRRQSIQTPVQSERQSYWNEFDDGSDVENEPYIIYVDPDTNTQIFGASTISHLFSKARGPMEKVRGWLGPMGSPRERRPLIQNTGYFTEHTEHTETDADVDDASSSDFPSGYATHYATFPSTRDQRMTRSRERLLFMSTIASFAASLVLLLVAGLLITTGKHKLRIEVDAGATVGIVSSLFFATLGFGTMLYRSERLSWYHRSSVTAAFVAVCILNGILLVLVVGNSGL